MSDYVVMQRDAAKVFLGGPPLVKMAIDEDADEESLGGAEMHARTSGLADYLAEDEADAIRIGREIVAHLGLAGAAGPTACAGYAGGAVPQPEPPRYDVRELRGIASADIRVPFEAREVIARIVDGSRFEEFKPLYGTTLVTGWAELAGRRIGILANNGILFGEEAQKGAHFIQLCSRADTPLLFLQNITGFMVGTKVRAGRHHQGRRQAHQRRLQQRPAPRDADDGSLLRCRQLWDVRARLRPALRLHLAQPPDRRDGPQTQLAGVLTIVARQKAGDAFDEAAVAPIRDAFEAQVESQSTALFATGRLWDDGIIDPADTRTVLALAFAACGAAADTVSAGPDAAPFGVFRM